LTPSKKKKKKKRVRDKKSRQGTVQTCKKLLKKENLSRVKAGDKLLGENYSYEQKFYYQVLERGLILIFKNSTFDHL